MALMSFREPNHVKRVGVRPAHDGEQVSEYASRVSAGTSIIYTVPAGKTFFWTAATLTHYHGSAAAWSGLLVFDAVPALDVYVWGMYINFTGSHDLSWTFNPPYELGAGYSVRLECGVGNILGWIHGFVE